MSTNKSIARSAGIISLGTVFSRILGFIRDLVIARLFGIYVYAQAFVVAFKLPNLFRDLVAEGAANAAFVPVFTEYKAKHTKEEFWELANVVLNLLLVVVSGLTIIGIILAPILVRLAAPGFITDPYKLQITIRLSRIIFPYILLIALTAYAAGILNSLKHFIVPAFAPCLLNISIVVFVLFFQKGTVGLALGVLAGGLLQLLVQVPVLYKKGFRINLFKRFRHPAARTIGRLMAPRIFSSGIYQLNNFVDSIFASLAFIVGEGVVAALYFAYRLIQFPLGIFSAALSQAILPEFSLQALEESPGKLKHTLSFGLRAVFFVTLPASIGFMVLAKPIIQSLFGGGKFDAYAVQLTAVILAYYSIGLCAYAANKILSSCFFALKDTVTPARVSFFSLIINVILNALLMFPMKAAGLALATSISGIITFCALILILRRNIGRLDLRAILFSFIKMLLAALCMGGICYFVWHCQILSGISRIARLFNLGAAISCGMIAYVVFCFMFRVNEMRDLWRWLAQRKI